MSLLSLAQDATVIMMHSRTPNLAARLGECDIVVAAIGKPGVIRSSQLKKGAVVVDVGINRLADGKVIGDVLHDADADHLAAATPVPGGVGPMTITMLLTNTLFAAEAHEKIRPELDTPVRSVLHP